MNKNIVIGFLILNCSIANALVEYFFNTTEGKNIIICEKELPAKKNPKWHKNYQKSLANNLQYRNPEQNLLLYNRSNIRVRQESQGKVSRFRCNLYKSIKQEKNNE